MNDKVIHIIPKGMPIRIKDSTYHTIICCSDNFFVYGEYAIVNKSFLLEYILVNGDATYVTFEDIKIVANYLNFIVSLFHEDTNDTYDYEKFINDAKNALSFDDLSLNDCVYWFLYTINRVYTAEIDKIKINDVFDEWYHDVIQRFLEEKS